MKSKLATRQCVTVAVRYGEKLNLNTSRTILMQDDGYDLEKIIKVFKENFIKEMEGEGIEVKDIIIEDIYRQTHVNYIEK